MTSRLNTPPRRHPLTLRFSPRAWETAFADDFFRKSLRPVRFTLVIALAVVGGGWLAVALGSPSRLDTPAGNLPRVLLLVIGLLALGVSFTPFFPRLMQVLLCSLVVLGGLGNIVVMAANRDLNDTVAFSAVTAILLMFYAFTLSRLSFVYAAPSAALITILWLITAQRLGLIADPGYTFLVIAAYAVALSAGYLGERHLRAEFVATQLLAGEREQSDRLLLNILPAPIADRLKTGEQPIADAHPEVSVLFVDLVGFTPLVSRVSPAEMVDLLNGVFSTFDGLAARYGLEKIKTIGDAYLAVAGLPVPRSDHAEAAAEMALDLLTALADRRDPTGQPLQVRIGLHSGPVVAGVIGLTKFAYDLWGDTVNLASRMESHGLPGAIQTTDTTYRLLKNLYLFEERGRIDVKGKGPLRVYLLKDRRDNAQLDRPRLPDGWPESIRN